MNIVLGPVAPERLHARAPLGPIHAQGAVEGVGRLLDVVGIHEQRFAHAVGGPGEAGEDQHPRIADLARRELEGDEIHAVAQGRDERDVCVAWNMTAPAECRLADADFPKTVVGDEIHICGSEIFRVVDGRITEVWNPPPMAGHWG